MKKRGYIVLVGLVVAATLFAISAGLVSYFTTYLKSERLSVASSQALALAEAGVDKAVYELNQNASYAGETGTALGNGTFSTSVTPVSGNPVRITSTGYVPSSVSPVARRTVVVTASVGTAAVSFHYGVQVGNGGLSMGNGATVNGSVYANGSIAGSGTITGDAIAAGTSTLTATTVNGNATAHKLVSCTVGKDAYYYATSTCTVSGTKHPGTADSPALPMPISDSQIADWEATAAAGGVIAGPYTLSGTKILGPVKINGNLTVNNGATLYLSGPVWVNGDTVFGNNSYFYVASTTGSAGAVLIGDATGQTAAHGIIALVNNTTIAGNGQAGSYPMALSTNTSNAAIAMNNNATSIILYAPHGGISIANGASANQVTAYTLIMGNVSTLNYVSGLQNVNFSEGPGGSWAVVPGTYAITQ